MAEFVKTIGDGHRHRYDKRPYVMSQNAVGAAFPFHFNIWKRRPSIERICVHCGSNERSVKHYQRIHPTSKPPQNTFQDAREAAMAAAQKIGSADRGGLNNFAIVYGDGPYRIKYYWGQPCYGGLGYGEKKTQYFIDRAVRSSTSLFPEYIDWCMTKGPYSMAFVNDPAHYLKTRCAVLDCTKLPAQYIVGAAMQLRYMAEKPHMSKNWTTLVELGVDPAIAFIAISYGQMKENGTFYKLNVTGCSSGHQLIGPDLGSEGLQHYLDHNIQTEYFYRAPYYVDEPPESQLKTLVTGYKSMYYRGLMNIWQTDATKQKLTMPGNKLCKIVDSFGRENTQTGFDFSKQTVDEFHTEFIKLNGVVYEPKESVYCKRRSAICSDVPKCGVESAAA